MRSGPVTPGERSTPPPRRVAAPVPVPFGTAAAVSVLIVAAVAVTAGTDALGEDVAEIAGARRQDRGRRGGHHGRVLDLAPRPRRRPPLAPVPRLGAAGWTGGMLLSTFHRLIAGHALQSPSLVDLGCYALPLFALPALCVFPTRPASAARPDGQVDDGTPHREPAREPIPGMIFVLDSLVVVGSVFLFAWSTALGTALAAAPLDEPESPSLAVLLVALGLPVADLLLVVFVVLIGTFRDPVNPRALLLLGLGFVVIAASHSLLLYRVTTGETLPPFYDGGFLLGPVLVGLALLVPPPAASSRRSDVGDLAKARRAVLLPYVPLTATGLVLVVQVVRGGSGIDTVEAVLGLVLIALVVVRQLTTLLDNVNLLHQVRDGQERLRRQAFNDSLTGLANRALFHERLRRAIDVHHLDEQQFALLFCDLDDFKHVNDRHGHAAGDELLQEVAVRLRRCVGTGDTVARLGGDEFAMLLESGAATAEDVGRRVLAALDRPFTVAGRGRGRGVPVRVGASVGLVVVDGAEDGLTPDALLARVDIAMYAAKRGGKSRLVAYGGEPASPGDSTAFLGDLRAALTVGPEAPPETAREMRQVAGAVEVMYQPIVHVGTGGVVALEALVRWRHPRLGVVPAEVLVHAATEAGLLGTLEEHVLDVACRDIRGLRETPGLGGLAVHVNVSATRTHDARLFAGVQDALDRFELPGSALVLEITETLRVPDQVGAADVLHQIRRLGVRLALDDFGTGYSGLSYLQDLPIDIVKLDRSITTADVGTRGAAIRNAVVGLARDLGIDLVAEGVETHGQAMHLAGLGCDYAQGFLYSRPRFLADLRFTTATSPIPASAAPAHHRGTRPASRPPAD